jgi:hypothetical protein
LGASWNGGATISAAAPVSAACLARYGLSGRQGSGVGDDRHSPVCSLDGLLGEQLALRDGQRSELASAAARYQAVHAGLEEPVDVGVEGSTSISAPSAVNGVTSATSTPLSCRFWVMSLLTPQVGDDHCLSSVLVLTDAD